MEIDILINFLMASLPQNNDKNAEVILKKAFAKLDTHVDHETVKEILLTNEDV